MGCGHDYAIKGMIFAFLAQVRLCMIVIGGEICSQMEKSFLFRSRDSPFLQSNVYISAKQNCRFLLREKDIQNVAAGFALFTVLEPRRFIG